MKVFPPRCSLCNFHFNFNFLFDCVVVDITALIIVMVTGQESNLMPFSFDIGADFPKELLFLVPNK